MYRVHATTRRLNHQLKTPAGSSDLAGSDPYLRDPVILSRVRARAHSSSSSVCLIPPPPAVLSEARIKGGQAEEEKWDEKDSPPRVFSRIRMYYSVHKCVNYCGSGGGLLLIGLLTSCSSRSRMKERHASRFSTRAWYAVLFIRRSYAFYEYARRKMQETFTSHI